jgi:hypothetical protein
MVLLDRIEPTADVREVLYNGNCHHGPVEMNPMRVKWVWPRAGESDATFIGALQDIQTSGEARGWTTVRIGSAGLWMDDPYGNRWHFDAATIRWDAENVREVIRGTGMNVDARDVP